MNDDFYKEEFFYSQNGSPTEIYKYCPYCLDCNGDDYNQFVLVVNCIIPYIRLAKKRGNYMSPCGMMACPDPNGSFAQLSPEEKEEKNPKIAFGITAEFLSNLYYEKDIHDFKYIHGITRQKLFSSYLNRFQERYLQDHSGLSEETIPLNKKLKSFYIDHLEQEERNWTRCIKLKDYPRLYEYASNLFVGYKTYVINIANKNIYVDKNYSVFDLRYVEDAVRLYPDVLKHLESGVDIFSKKEDLRHGLDDMRLALELLLKHLLSNEKSLENQNSDLGVYLKKAGISKEISNTFFQIKGLYERFQNNNVKHDDNINLKEVEYIYQQTLCFMNLLLKVQ